MAYTADMYRITVRGNIGLSEAFSNTWSFFDVAGGQDVQDVGDILHNLYEDWYGFASWISASTQCVGATARNMGTGDLTELSWGGLTGSAAAELLPTQLAMRISLRNNTVKGGPFIGGFAVAANDFGGLINDDLVADFIGALETFTAALTAAEWNLDIDRPTALTMVHALHGKVGHRFDDIGKRKNDTAEAYASFATS